MPARTNTKRAHEDTEHVGIARFLNGSKTSHEQSVRALRF